MKKHSSKFWFFFWMNSIIFLFAWYIFCEIKFHGISPTAENILKILPLEAHEKKQFQALAKIGDLLIERDNQVRIFLLLFQNNLELRPGGGFIGSFGILKMQNGKIISLKTYDVSEFDARIPNVLDAPYPIPEIMHTTFWKLRDSNFSPDFEIDAQNAEKLYHLGQGEEKFDGVIGITSNVLESFLKITGPVQMDGYPGTYDSGNAIISLEYQVEKAFVDQGIERDDRKSVMGELAREIQQKMATFSIVQKINLVKTVIKDLDNKDIQLQFDDPKIQAATESASWSGKINEKWNSDYLAINDANLGAYKSDYYIKRAVDYTVDFSQENPQAQLKISYAHTAKQKDWMTTNYLTYLRVYVPEGSEYKLGKNFDNPVFGNEFGKMFMGAIVRVPIDSTFSMEINYELPKNITQENYKLMLQKQAGVNDVPFNFHVIKKDGNKIDLQYSINSDIII